jgi:hypothetical protein
MKGFELLSTRKEGGYTVRTWLHIETGGKVVEYQRPDWHHWEPLDHKGRGRGTCRRLSEALDYLRRNHIAR